MAEPTSFDPNAAADPDSGLYGLPDDPQDAGVIIIPVPWDVTTSYRAGTANGPSAILQASKQVDLYDVETGRPYRAGIAMLELAAKVRGWNAEGRALAEPIIAAGGNIDGDDRLLAARAHVNELGTRLNDWVRTQAERWLDAGKLVGVLGGDHSTPFGLIATLAQRHPGMGILHIDAHADLRHAYEGFTWSHASIMYNVLEHLPGVAKLVQVGIRDLCEAEVDIIKGSGGRVVTHFDTEVSTRRYAGQNWAGQCERIVEALPENVYISFDIDGLDPTLCPHTGTPVPGGLLYPEALMLLGAVTRTGRKIVGFDLNEVAPDPGGDEWDANVGARLLYKLIGQALASSGKSW